MEYIYLQTSILGMVIDKLWLTIELEYNDEKHVQHIMEEIYCI